MMEGSGMGYDMLSTVMGLAMGSVADMVNAISGQGVVTNPRIIKQNTSLNLAFGGNPVNVPATVEGGETFETPDGQKGEFEGPDHEQGGVDVDLPENTKIYSKRLKRDGKTMKDRKAARDNMLRKAFEQIDSDPIDVFHKGSAKAAADAYLKEEIEDTLIGTAFSMIDNGQEGNEMKSGGLKKAAGGTVDPNSWEEGIDPLMITDPSQRRFAYATSRTALPRTNMRPYQSGAQHGNGVKFKDRTYFGKNDILPYALMKDLVQSSKQIGVDPMDALVLSAVENRFDPALMGDEGALMRVTAATYKDKYPDFTQFIMKKGYHGGDKNVIKSKEGYFLSGNFFEDIDIEELDKYWIEYRHWYEKQEKPPDLPFAVPLMKLKEKGFQGYNPQEKKGNYMYGDKNNRFSKDRMERYAEVKKILESEPEFMQAFQEAVAEPVDFVGPKRPKVRNEGRKQQAAGGQLWPGPNDVQETSDFTMGALGSLMDEYNAFQDRSAENLQAIQKATEAKKKMALDAAIAKGEPWALKEKWGQLYSPERVKDAEKAFSTYDWETKGKKAKKIPNQYASGGINDPGDPILDEIYKKYPGFKKMGSVTLKADKNYTKDKTGRGDIEYFSPTQDTITYTGTGYKVPHPNMGTHGIYYNPETNDSQQIMLDMLHGMGADPGYAKLYKDFQAANLKNFKGDFEKHWQRVNAETKGENDGKEQEWKNWVDGNLRSLMFQGTDEDYIKHNYRKEDKDLYLSRPDIKASFDKIQTYLSTNDDQKMEMRRKRIPNQYAKGGTIMKKYQSGGEVLPGLGKGDPYEYTFEEGVWKTRKKGSTDWIDLSGNQAAIDKLNATYPDAMAPTSEPPKGWFLEPETMLPLSKNKGLQMNWEAQQTRRQGKGEVNTSIPGVPLSKNNLWESQQSIAAQNPSTEGDGVVEKSLPFLFSNNKGDLNKAMRDNPGELVRGYSADPATGAIENDILSSSSPKVTDRTDPTTDKKPPFGIDGELATKAGVIGNTLLTVFNRLGDTPNKNPYEDYGTDALRTLDMGMQQTNRAYEKGLQNIKLSEQGQRNRNRGSARGINTLRALDISTTSASERAASQLGATYMEKLRGLFQGKAETQKSVDYVQRQGADMAGQRDKRDRDKFFTNLSSNWTDMSKGYAHADKMKNWEAAGYNPDQMNSLGMLEQLMSLMQ